MRGMEHSKTNQTCYRICRRALNNWGKEKDRDRRVLCAVDRKRDEKGFGARMGACAVQRC